MFDAAVLKEQIEDAQLVLVGLGEEFECAKLLKNNNRYVQICEEISRENAYEWLMPYINYIFLRDNEKISTALRNLHNLLDGKNYFIVTTCMNGIIESSELNKERIVSPCGNFFRMQCVSEECEALIETPKWLLEQVEEFVNGSKQLNEIDIVKCVQCDEVMAFNSLYTENYKESGYLQQWQLYTKWLQGTLNKQVCVIELGVSLRFPSVIRFPFEKIAFFNQKASFVRVHETLYQLSEELGNKGVSLAQNAVDFLAESF